MIAERAPGSIFVSRNNSSSAAFSDVSDVGPHRLDFNHFRLDAVDVGDGAVTLLFVEHRPGLAKLLSSATTLSISAISSRCSSTIQIRVYRPKRDVFGLIRQPQPFRVDDGLGSRAMSAFAAPKS